MSTKHENRYLDNIIFDEVTVEPLTNEPLLNNAMLVQSYLGRVEYPASKVDLLNQAHRNGADLEVMLVLGELPDVKYETPTDLDLALIGMV